MVEPLDKPDMTTCLAASKVSTYNEYRVDETRHPPWLLCICKTSEYEESERKSTDYENRCEFT